MINLVAITQFFKAICTRIFKRLLAIGSIENGLLGSVLTYFGIVETNSQGILHLDCLSMAARRLLFS